MQQYVPEVKTKDLSQIVPETLQLWCERMLDTGAIDPERYRAYLQAHSLE